MIHCFSIHYRIMAPFEDRTVVIKRHTNKMQTQWYKTQKKPYNADIPNYSSQMVQCAVD